MKAKISTVIWMLKQAKEKLEETINPVVDHPDFSICSQLSNADFRIELIIKELEDIHKGI